MSRTQSRREKRVHSNISKGIAWNAFQIERLETRTLLSGGLLVAVDGEVGAPNTGLGQFLPIPNGTVGTDYITVTPEVDGTAGYGLQITGDVIVQWYKGGEVADLPLDHQTGGNSSIAFTDETPVTLNEADAGPAIPSGPLKGFHILYNYYTGDGNFAPTAQFTDAQFQDATEGRGAAAQFVKFSDTSTPGVETQVSFIQQPQNTAQGDKISPAVTVVVQDSSGATVTGSSSVVTLSLSGGDGTASLSGITSAAVVNGIATFNNLSVDKPGNYNLTASSGTDSSALSSAFTVTGGKLVFIAAPHDGTADEALQPAVTVALEDGSGKILTDNSSTVVTLSPIGVSDGNPITGNTATLVNGVATFSNVQLAKPGFYQLQATDGGDTQATSGKFKVAGDHLVIQKQPANADANADIGLTVAIEDDKNKIVTDAATTIVLALNPATAGSAAQLSGTTTLAFVNGIAVFSTAAGPAIDTAGKYTFTLTEEDFSTGVLAPTNTTTPITSKPFSVGGFQLVFLKKPVITDVNVPLAFSVALEDSKHKIDTNKNDGGVLISLQATADGAGAQLSAFTNLGFQNGVDIFTGAQAPSINAPGTYTITASEVDAGGVAVATTLPATFKPLKISGLHLAFIKQPADANIQDKIPFTVAVEDAKNKIDTTDSSTVLQVSTPGAMVESGTIFPTVVNGVAVFGTFSLLVSGNVWDIGDAGTYQFHISADDDPSITAGVSKSFKVTGYHLVFTKQPKDVDYGDADPFSIAIEDVKHKINTSDNDTMIIVNGNQPVTLSNGVYNSTGVLRSDALAGKALIPGAYTLSTAQVSPPNLTTPAVSAESAKFKIGGFHLVFHHQPAAGTAVNGIIGFTVAILNDKNQIVDTENSDGVQITVAAVGGGAAPQTTGLTQVTFENGLAPFGGQGEFSIQTPGTYVITAVEVDPGLGESVFIGVTTPATSSLFKIV